MDELLPVIIQDAVQAMKKLPGIGEKSALRLVLNMSRWKPYELEELAYSFLNLKNVKKCLECRNLSDGEVCHFCTDENRKRGQMLCVLENPTDLLAIERSGNFKGRYYILNGVLNPLLGISPDSLGLDVLASKIKQWNIKTVILAINPSVEGDATCSYIKSILPSNLSIERIGFGVPIGGSLEYLDPLTISKALENRKII